MSADGREWVDGVNNFTPRARQVLTLAREEAARLNHNFVGTEHLLLGLISLGQGTAVNLLGKMGLDLNTARAEVERQIGAGQDHKVISTIPYTPRVKKALALAAKEAKALNHTYVGTEHILLGLLREGDGVAARVLANFGVKTEETRQHVLNELDPNHAPMPDAPVVPEQPPKPQQEPVDVSKRYDVYCREGDREVVYRNARFKSVKTLFKRKDYDFLSEYLELEQTDGQTIFITRSSIFKFCEHGMPPGSEIIQDGGS